MNYFDSELLYVNLNVFFFYIGWLIVLLLVPYEIQNLLLQSGKNSMDTPLVFETVDGAVDYKGQPVLRSHSGGWRSAYFIIGTK